MKIGDTVALIDHDLRGKIVKINEKQVSFEDIYGFVHHYPKKELLHYSEKIDYKIDAKKISEKIELKKKTSKKHEIKLYQIDMHWDKVAKKLGRDMKSSEAWERSFLLKNYLRKELEIAQQKNYKSVEIIHGIGDGILQKEIYTWLNEMANIRFDEAHFFTESIGSVFIDIF